MPQKHLQNKKLIRQQINTQRKQLSQTQMKHAAKACCEKVVASKLLENASNIALYLQHINELNPLPLIETLWDQGKQTYLPIVEENSPLSFARYEKHTELRLSRYQIAEPITKQCCSLSNLDVMFLPLVAFDANGNRLGMGGGYYDRTLANRTDNDGLITVGLAYEFQKVEQLPTEIWDQPMDMIITDKNIYHVKHNIKKF